MRVVEGATSIAGRYQGGRGAGHRALKSGVGQNHICSALARYDNKSNDSNVTYIYITYVCVYGTKKCGFENVRWS